MSRETLVNPTAERNIISIVLQDPSKIIECEGESLTSEHFGIRANRLLYTVIGYLAEEGIKKIGAEDVYSVLQSEEQVKTIDDFGGREYIEVMLRSIKVSDNLPLYIKQVREQATRRLIFDLGESLKEDCIEEDLDAMLMDAQKKINDISLGDTKKDVNKIGDGLLERIQARMENPREVFGHQIGWTRFDKITQGFAPNDLTVVVGASKTGKSTLLTNWSRILSIRSGLCGLYIDTEMTTEEQEDRLLAMCAEIPYEEIRNGSCGTDTEYGTAIEKHKKMLNAIREIKDANLFHVYMPDFNIQKVTALIKKMHLTEQIDYCVFDYIKMPNEDVKGLASAQEHQRLGFFTTCLKDMAGICNIPIITACQANRNDLETTNPSASDIGGSYKILQLATKLLFIRNKISSELEHEGYQYGNQALHILYQRHGGGGEKVHIQFDRPILRQFEVSTK